MKGFSPKQSIVTTGSKQGFPENLPVKRKTVPACETSGADERENLNKFYANEGLRMSIFANFGVVKPNTEIPRSS